MLCILGFSLGLCVKFYLANTGPFSAICGVTTYMANQVEGFIALLVILMLFVLVGTVGRLWILRHRPRTLSVNISDGAFVLFSILIFIAVGLAFDGVNSELHIERRYGGADIDARLLTPKYLKVSRS